MNKTVPGASPRQDPVAGQEYGGAEGQAEKQDLCLPEMWPIKLSLFLLKWLEATLLRIDLGFMMCKTQKKELLVYSHVIPRPHSPPLIPSWPRKQQNI